MKVRRDVASLPVRSASETWKAIIDLVTRSGCVDAEQLRAAASVMESLIVDGHPASVPIVIKGNGPRLVIYCLYGEDAMEAGKEINRLHWNPTGGDWSMTAPCDRDDVGWMTKTLQSRAPRISVHEVGEAPPSDAHQDKASSESSELVIDWKGMKKP